MIKLGRFNTLNVVKASPVGAVLDGGEVGNILLTADHQRFMAGDEVKAFIYLDSEGQLAATLKQPLAQLGEVAWLKIVEVNNVGAFVDWGLPKDLFIPFAEQHCQLDIGRHVLVKVYLDNQNRLTGTTRIDHVIEDESAGLKEKQQVSLIIAEKTELGYKAIINHQYWGLLYDNELRHPLKKGEQHSGYIKKIRDDNKIDLSLQPVGYNQQHKDLLSEKILNELENNAGYIPLNDKSSPDSINATFGVSKKAFKKSCGALYKLRLIEFEGTGIRRTDIPLQ
jgi:uncharacterized protein